MLDEENLDPRQYFEIRSKTIAQLQHREKDPINPYPHKFHVNTAIGDFLQKYKDLKDGESLKDVEISVAGRVHSIRVSGKKLKFYDLHADGTKVQIHANAA